jgi:hypothetical protein
MLQLYADLSIVTSLQQRVEPRRQAPLRDERPAEQAKQRQPGRLRQWEGPSRCRSGAARHIEQHIRGTCAVTYCLSTTLHRALGLFAGGACCRTDSCRGLPAC